MSKPGTDARAALQLRRLQAVSLDPGASLEASGLFRAGVRVLYA
jgi:hypothetical protein